MADILKGLFGGPSAPSQTPLGDSDFADFAAAPSPQAASAPSLAGAPVAQQTFGANVPIAQRPFTKWYRVWERVSIADFYTEFMILPFLVALFLVHIWGTRRNKSKAKRWMSAHAPTLAAEFATLGFSGKARPSADATEATPIPDAGSLLKGKSSDLYLSYASGRQNVAFVDVKFSLKKRYNPLLMLGEGVVGFFFDGYPPPVDRVEVTAYAFDGKESVVVPPFPGQELEKKSGNSSYEGFVWAVVHKDRMKTLRDERYDLSLTVTKENAKLPNWATVMSESAEVTDTLLTNELVKTLKEVGEDFESLIVTDLPADAPKTLDELKPKKRLLLTTKLGADEAASKALLTSFIRIADTLASTKFRPEVLKRVRATREEESKKIKKVEDLEKAGERKEAADKAKKEEREKKLKGMSADEQRKFLDREREKEQKKTMGRRTVKA